METRRTGTGSGAHERPAGPAGPADGEKEAGQIFEIHSNGKESSMLRQRKVTKGLRGHRQVREAVLQAFGVLFPDARIRPTKAYAKAAIKARFGGSIAGAGNRKVGADTVTYNISTTWGPDASSEAAGFTCPEAVRGTCQILRAIQMERGAPIGQSVADAGEAIAHQLVNRCYAAADNRQYGYTRSRDARSQKAFRDNSLSAKELAAWMVLSWWVEATSGKMRNHFGHSDLRLRWTRFNVRGGARSVADFLRMAAIGKALLTEYGIMAYTYTSRMDLWAEVEPIIDPNHLTVTGSNFMAHNNFRVVPEGSLGVQDGARVTASGTPICPGSCANCHICKIGHATTVVIEQH